MSACYINRKAKKLQKDCLKEAKWVAKNLENSDKSYLSVYSASLQDPNVGKTLKKLAKDPNVRGIR